MSLVEEDLTHVSFKDPAFLGTLGLHEHNALDYFALSQFYDKKSINEEIIMQSRFNQLQANQLNRKAMKGIEYELGYFSYQPSLFIIRKLYRTDERNAALIGLYYIIEGTIYQAPDLATLLSNHMITSLHHVQKAFDEAVTSVRYHPSHGYMWSIDEEAIVKSVAKSKEEAEASQDPAGTAVASSVHQRLQAIEFVNSVDAMVDQVESIFENLKQDDASQQGQTHWEADLDELKARVQARHEAQMAAASSGRIKADSEIRIKRKKKSMSESFRVTGPASPLPGSVLGGLSKKKRL
ncbi:MED6 mediator sub complex component-domain-containing protein [Polychytrium aggregatum]|uniref:MED6 mediator sub complex component-domain-containing protein n=1 Tax=Polychytrium aggregatum TaxID=110093 RepID=UPI0022FDB8B1|nr:MED6 mediator sub complex component-domain-containing protein [Polychytrium aggregatum]KAI9201892.1 MED6 mediator sub complex component-domain-containing protein [Polychytrium aggregatum]